MENDSPKETVTRKKAYAPTDDDYELTGFRIEEAENGVVVSCSYKMKDAIKDKLNNGNGNYVSAYCDDEKHVYETKDDAKKFIILELDALWP